MEGSPMNADAILFSIEGERMICVLCNTESTTWVLSTISPNFSAAFM